MHPLPPAPALSLAWWEGARVKGHPLCGSHCPFCVTWELVTVPTPGPTLHPEVRAQRSAAWRAGEVLPGAAMAHTDVFGSAGSD